MSEYLNVPVGCSVPLPLNDYQAWVAATPQECSEGPWVGEPDRIAWTTATGLSGLMVRARLGAWGGYVSVPTGHPLFMVDCWDVPDEVNLAAHVRMTYSDYCRGDGTVCHLSEPGVVDDRWWLGFECTHFGDVVPGTASIGFPTFGVRERYRDAWYVVEVVERLARAIAGYQHPEELKPASAAEVSA